MRLRHSRLLGPSRKFRSVDGNQGFESLPLRFRTLFHDAGDLGGMLKTGDIGHDLAVLDPEAVEQRQ